MLIQDSRKTSASRIATYQSRAILNCGCLKTLADAIQWNLRLAVQQSANDDNLVSVIAARLVDMDQCDDRGRAGARITTAADGLTNGLFVVMIAPLQSALPACNCPSLSH